MFKNNFSNTSKERNYHYVFRARFIQTKQLNAILIKVFVVPFVFEDELLVSEINKNKIPCSTISIVWILGNTVRAKCDDGSDIK